MAYKPIDIKRDQFRKYLESSGVIEVLSRSITKLMEIPEKPDSPVEFIRHNMGCSQKEQDRIEFLQGEVASYKKQVDDLKKEIAGLKLERKELENSLTNDAIKKEVKIEAVDVAETKSEKVNNDNEKKSEGIPQSAQVLENGKNPVEEVQKVEISTDIKSVEVQPIETIEEKAVENVTVPLVVVATSETTETDK